MIQQAKKSHYQNHIVQIEIKSLTVWCMLQPAKNIYKRVQGTTGEWSMVEGG